MAKRILTKGSRVAIIGQLSGRWTVYVGYQGSQHIPGEETIPGRWFKGYKDCSATFATEKTALKKAQEFLTH
jgi:hypothetical protein